MVSNKDKQLIPTGEKNKTFRNKYFIFLIPIFVTSFFLMLIDIKVEVNFKPQNIFSLDKNNIDYDEDDFLNGIKSKDDVHFFVKTEGCLIPAFGPFDESILPYYEESVKPINCYNETNPPLIESNDTSLWVVDKYFKNYHVHHKKKFLCCFRPFFRPNSSESTSDNRYEYSSKCVAFGNSVNVYFEFVKVECAYDGKKIYEDFHSFVIPKFKNIPRPIKPTFNVLIMGLDAVSRLNFHRTMQKTLKTLQDLDAIELKGYNKVGDNTFPNLVPVLSGMTDVEFNSLCHPKGNISFDNCPLIWQNYSKAGYTTAFAEDGGGITLFNYCNRGFSETPTDYYWRTFNYLSEHEIGHDHRMNANLCIGPRLSSDILLSYTQKFTRSMKNEPYFGFFWQTSLTHDYLNFPKLGDEQYSEAIQEMKNEGILNSTVLILMSDHGIRWGSIRTTSQGRMEERLPFLFFVFPDAFKKKYPRAIFNIERNANKLTTPFDYHETLSDMIDLTQIENDNIIARTINKPYMDSRGVSLFLPIRESRTCESAGIDPHWCTCHLTSKLDIRNNSVVQVADFVLERINEAVLDYPQCRKLSLTKIIDATIGEPSELIKMDMVEDYTIVMQTDPGAAVFEATVRQTKTGWNLTGTISRINLYGTQSYCVNDVHLKLYCFCNIPYAEFIALRRNA